MYPIDIGPNKNEIHVICLFGGQHSVVSCMDPPFQMAGNKVTIIVITSVKLRNHLPQRFESGSLYTIWMPRVANASVCMGFWVLYTVVSILRTNNDIIMTDSIDGCSHVTTMHV